MLKHGPVDVVILALGAPSFDGSILYELEQQVGKGVIRVLDAMLLFKDDAGNRASVDLEDLPANMKTAMGFIETGTRGLFDSADADTLFEGMVPSSAVLALAIEHIWAVNLVNALSNSDVELAASIRIPAPIVDEAFAAFA
ncbi:MAG: hypothetical protein DCC52_03140 [Chloroflexi bacterium]|nr:MAG: hypothetical protein DCC52_03140 [Chloroflexota bacterium]